jgi:transposase
VAFNFVACDRDQELLLPPSLREWLAEDHLAWFVLDAVEAIDLGVFYAEYRGDGWGRAAFDPKMMVALLLYAYAVGERSSRQIERRCREDVAFRVIARTGSLITRRSRGSGCATSGRSQRRSRRCWCCVRVRVWCRSGWWR